MKHARIRQMAFFFGGVFGPRLRALAPTSHSALMARQLERQFGLGQTVDLTAWQSPTLTTITPAMAELLAELAGRVRLTVLLDWPQAWAQAGLGGLAVEVVDLVNVGACVDERTQFEELLAHGVLRAGHSLIVEPLAQRALAALDCGLDVAIYEDVPRLRRDLGLWGLIAD